MKGCRARITIAPLRERVDRILLLRAALLQEISQAFLLFSASFPMRAQRSRPTVVRYPPSVGRLPMRKHGIVRMVANRLSWHAGQRYQFLAAWCSM
jgi:hypothetical protein